VVVGVGNVAMDVTRILVRDREELAKTDIAEHAVEALRASRVTDVHVLGRRGPVQAAFSPAEIKEIAELDDVDLLVRTEDLELDPGSAAELEASPDKTVHDNVAFLRSIAGQTSTGGKRVHLHLLTSPISYQGDGRVERVEIGRNRLEPRASGGLAARDTGVRAVVDASLVFRAVGYRGIPVPGVPFDDRTGTIPNEAGRVVRDGAAIDRLYVVGWAKRGPSGLIGTNRADSRATVDRMLEDVPRLDPAPRAPLSPAGALGWAEWQQLDAAECSRGQERGKLREKFVRVADMLAALGR
jgi:ferredoxin--NADP+ reductase